KYFHNIAQPITHFSTMVNTRYAIHPSDFKTYDTKKIRDSFLIGEVFKPGEITFTYTMYDRMIVGGSAPVDKPLLLETIDELKSEYFLERRELGVINVGPAADVTVDG